MSAQLLTMTRKSVANGGIRFQMEPSYDLREMSRKKSMLSLVAGLLVPRNTFGGYTAPETKVRRNTTVCL